MIYTKNRSVLHCYQPTVHYDGCLQEQYLISHKDFYDEKQVEIGLAFLNASAGEEGYYVIPNAKVCFLTNFSDREDTEYICAENIMPIVGAKLGEKAYLVMIEGMSYDYQLKMTVKDGQYALALNYDLTKIDLYEDIAIRVITLTGEEANYSGIARFYRRIMEKKLNLIPLAERVKTNPVLDYGADNMPVIRVRMAW